MRILTRYVLFELLKVFSVSLTGLTLFLLLVFVVKEAYLQGLGLKQILLLIPYFLPQAALFAIPASILLGVCSTFGRLASGNEVVAVKASGISPMVLLMPALILSFLLSLVTVWVNDVAVSWGRQGAIRVVIESVEEIAYSRLQQQHAYSTKTFSINVLDVDGKKLLHPIISIQGSGDDPPQTVTCDEAVMDSDLENQSLTIACTNGSVQYGDVSFEFPDTQVLRIPLDEASRSGTGGNVSPSNLALHIIPEAKEQQRTRIQTLEERMAAQAAYQMITGDFAGLTGPSWGKDQRQITEARQRLYRLNMEPFRRWSDGFSCLCFVLVGAPLAIIMRNSDFLTSFFMCFLPILIVYYPLMMFGVSQAKSGSFPSSGVWAGNLILMVIGAWCIRRVCRY